MWFCPRWALDVRHDTVASVCAEAGQDFAHGRAGQGYRTDLAARAPATCPECGARVDQSTESMAEHPECLYCAKPLPCEPVR